MSLPINLLITTLLIYVVGAFISLAVRRNEQLSINISGVTGVLAGVLGIVACIPVLISSDTVVDVFKTPFEFASFSIRIDGLAAFMVCVISLLVIVTALYSFSYVKEYKGKGAGSMGFFMNLFIASMVALVTSDNAFYFLVFFEMMSLASYFLVITEQDENAVNEGLLYFFIAHAGSVLIMIAFFIFYCYAGSFEFSAFRQTTLPAPLAFTAFVLAFLVFGAKAGMIPLHSWLPKAHPAAPSSVSALMSGVMIKFALFTLVKFTLYLPLSTYFGLTILALGAASSLFGVLYALCQHDFKALLAYHSVENIGIILLGLGTGIYGVAAGNLTLAAVGFLAGCYHVVNHAIFKGLLFLCAGSVIHATHTQNMDILGGLAKKMPWTSLGMFIGIMGIAALPPVNGFVSEWFTYQGMLQGAMGEGTLVRYAFTLGVVALALTGVLVGMHLKLYAVIFAGTPRDQKIWENAKESPIGMVLGMIILMIGCVGFGLGANYIVDYIMQAVNSIAISDYKASLGAINVT